MILKVKSSKEKIYKTFFNYLAVDNDWNLTSTDLDIANELFIKNYNMLDTVKDFNKRMEIIFSKTIKESIYKSLNLSYNTFNNSLTRLRKTGLINDNKLNETICKINIDKGISLTISLCLETI